MTNFEKYKDDLIKIEGEFAVDKNTRKIAECNCNIECVDCLFNSGNCSESDKMKWLYSEYKEPILSDNEIELIDILGKINRKKYKYVAKDADDVTRLYEVKPIKPRADKSGNYYGEYIYVDIGACDKILFSNITHKDGLYDIENKCFIKE